MILALILVLTVTGIDLVKPVLIGNAIDKYIEGYDTPYVQVPADQAQVTLRQTGLSKDAAAGPDARYARLIYFEEEYFLVRDLEQEDLAAVNDWEKAGYPGTEKLQLYGSPTVDTLSFSVNGKDLMADEMSRDELALLRSSDRTGITRIALIYACLLIIGFFLQRWQSWLLQKTGQSIIFTIRQEVFTHVHSLPLRFFDTNPVGRIVTRVTNDVESLNQMYTQVLVRLISNTVLIIGYAVVMISINPRLALISFLFLPIVFGMTLFFRIQIRRIYRIVRTKISGLNTFLSENISGMKLIQLFAREKTKSDEFRERTDDLYRSQMKEMMIFGCFRPGLSFLANIAYALIIYRSGVSVLEGTLTLGTLYIFTNYIRSFFEPIQELAEQFSTLQNAMASAEKIFTVLDEKNTIEEPENPVPLRDFRGKIEFRNVWFAYENEDYVLKDVSFVIRPGERVAFVGATGAGKSSILNLIGRYYDIQKGEILIDDVNIRDLSLEELRGAIGQVQQDVFIFTGDIRSNIRLLNDDIPDEKIRAAAEAANADHFIHQLPAGFDEPVTERGSTLSAGERQLLSFARTLAFDPKILVLDEATANIDTETEQLIQEALETLMQGRTSILVAHRLSTIQHADEILVMHKGRIRERGTHQQLLAMNGIYKKLYELQQ
ncbi:MAG: ABC transporter ATP-binding protein [Lachnospiraceae bacterium]|nr:ABC transporter ATP-binding protein [Lachnospiraceae bacterium]